MGKMSKQNAAMAAFVGKRGAHAGSHTGMKPRQKIIVLDSDDTIYRNNWTLATQLTQNIQDYCTANLGLAKGEAYKLYKKHGTTIKGLLNEGLLPHDKIDEFLDEVHMFENIKELIKPDPKLRDSLLRMKAECFVFTAGPRSHAIRCWTELGVDDILVQSKRPIIDAKMCKLISKYCVEAYSICLEKMQQFLGTTVDPKDLVFVDDNYKNLRCAKKAGWGTCILMGRFARDGTERFCDDAVDYIIEHVSDLEAIYPELFSTSYE